MSVRSKACQVPKNAPPRSDEDVRARIGVLQQYLANLRLKAASKEDQIQNLLRYVHARRIPSSSDGSGDAVALGNQAKVNPRGISTMMSGTKESRYLRHQAGAQLVAEDAPPRRIVRFITDFSPRSSPYVVAAADTHSINLCNRLSSQTISGGMKRRVSCDVGEDTMGSSDARTCSKSPPLVSIGNKRRRRSPSLPRSSPSLPSSSQQRAAVQPADRKVSSSRSAARRRTTAIGRSRHVPQLETSQMNLSHHPPLDLPCGPTVMLP